MTYPVDKYESQKINEYAEKGYTASYRMEDGKLKDLQTNKTFSPEEVTIINEYRYEGMSDPNDMSILYAINTSDGNKGTLLAPYGPYANVELMLFMKDASSVVE